MLPLDVPPPDFFFSTTAVSATSSVNVNVATGVVFSEVLYTAYVDEDVS